MIVKDSLFNAPEDAWLVHACNAQGVWGSGIAKEFKEKYPSCFEQYKKMCDTEYVMGKALITKDTVTNRTVVCLITSFNYGDKKDMPWVIISNTIMALNDLYPKLPTAKPLLCSNKFNSGLFDVPWENTEEVLRQFIKDGKLNWLVYEGEAK